MDYTVYDTTLRGVKYLLTCLAKHTQEDCRMKLSDLNDIQKITNYLKSYAWTELQNSALDTVLMYRNGWAHCTHTRSSWFRLGEAIPILRQWLSTYNCRNRCDIPCTLVLCDVLRNTCSLLFSSRRVYMIGEDPISNLQEPMPFIRSRYTEDYNEEASDGTHSVDEQEVTSEEELSYSDTAAPPTTPPNKPPAKWEDLIDAPEEVKWCGTIADLITSDALTPDSRITIASGSYERIQCVLVNWNTSKGTANVTLSGGRTVSLPLLTQVEV